jgi:hypothetical protein
MRDRLRAGDRIFRSGTTISASAIAKSTPTDTFTLSSSLASLNGGLANQLLQLLTGSPNALTLNAVDYQGLAQVNLKLAGILANLPVGSSTSVLNGTVTLGQLANAMIQAATQQNVASVKLNVLNAITAGLCSAGACGGPTIALNQLVSVATATGSSAVDASVNAFRFAVDRTSGRERHERRIHSEHHGPDADRTGTAAECDGDGFGGADRNAAFHGERPARAIQLRDVGLRDQYVDRAGQRVPEYVDFAAVDVFERFARLSGWHMSVRRGDAVGGVQLPVTAYVAPATASLYPSPAPRTARRARR